MTNFSSSFDELLSRGRQQFDQLAGNPISRSEPAPPELSSSAESPSKPVPDNKGSIVIEGTAGGIPFRLITK